MSGEVRQDSDAIREVASSIEADKEELEKLTEELYDVLKNGITESDDNPRTVWFGPSAKAFYDGIEGQRGTFDTGAANLQKTVTNLEEHADTWDQFENRG